MAKVKKALSQAQKQLKKAAKAERQKKYQWVLMGGKQIRVKCEQTIDGLAAGEFMSQNANPILLHQIGLYEELHAQEGEMAEAEAEGNDLPF